MFDNLPIAIPCFTIFFLLGAVAALFLLQLTGIEKRLKNYRQKRVLRKANKKAHTEDAPQQND